MEQSLTPEIITQLQCVILPGKHVAPEGKDYCQAIYAFWHEEWSATFKNDSKEKVPDILYSDDFRRQDQIVCLLHQAKPIATFSLDLVNVELLVDRQQRCLRHYPTEFLQELCDSGNPEAIIMSYMLVSKAWRRYQSNVPIAYILPGIAAKILLASSAGCVMATSRNDVKADDVGRHHGFRLHSDLKLYGVAASIMIMKKSTVKICDVPGVNDAVNYLWENRLDFSKGPAISEHSQRHYSAV